MNTEVAPAADAEPTSKEERFFGITTPILTGDKKPKEDDEKDEIIIESAEEKAATPEEPAAKPEKKGASDKDIEEHSENVQKRINKLTYEREEAKRQATTVAAERDEAFKVAKNLYAQSQQQASIISSGEARLVDQIKDRARLAAEQATAKFGIAYDSGDTEAIIAAQKEMITAQHEERAAHEYDNEYQARVRNWAATQQQQQAQRQQQWQAQQRRPPVQQQQPQAKAPSEAANKWAENNSWFGKDEHRDMTAIAYATHETMIKDKGISPDSDQYFEGLDATMRQRFPEYFEADQGHSGQSASKPNVVVAPATRGGTTTRKVTLNASQRQLVKTLGITEEAYARQFLKGDK